MFPIRDHNPSGATPYVTWGLILMNIAVFLWTRVTLTEVAQNYFNFEWGMIPARLSYGEGWVTVLTAMFLHGGWVHLGSNMLFLWIFGDNMEASLGRVRFLAFYLAAGVIAALAEYGMAPLSRSPVIGASGAIAGVLGGYLLLFPKARVDVLIIFVIFFKIFPLPAWSVLGFWILLQVYSGATGQNDGVAYWEHIGGFVGGLLLSVPLWLKRKTSKPDTTLETVRSTIPKVSRHP
jgi:membrane associated rhomboid family serine protease